MGNITFGVVNTELGKNEKSVEKRAPTVKVKSKKEEDECGRLFLVSDGERGGVEVEKGAKYGTFLVWAGMTVS